MTTHSNRRVWPTSKGVVAASTEPVLVLVHRGGESPPAGWDRTVPERAPNSAARGGLPWETPWSAR